MRLRDLTHQIPPQAAGDVSITGLAYDSRLVQPGGLFAAWRGARADGHVHVPEALRRGASVILCEREVDSGDVPRWVVPNVRRTLAELARGFYHDPSVGLRTVAVTGTNGKTTSVCILESIFAAAGYQPGIIGTLGNRYAGKSTEGTLTTPESVDLTALLENMRQAGVDAVAMEASSQALAQHRVDGVRFDAAIFTNLTHDHLDYHGTEEAYFAAKARLFADLLKDDAWGVVNADDPWARRVRAKNRLTFSRTQSEADVAVHDARLDRSGIAMTLRTPRGPLQLTSPLLGAFNVDNILGCVAVGVALDISDNALERGIAQVPQVPGRLERVSGPHEPLVLVDYAHTPDAVQQVLAAVRALVVGRVICVFGCGGDRDPRKRAPMGRAAQSGAHYAILTNDNPRSEDPQGIANAVEIGMRQGGGTRHAQVVSGGYDVVLDRHAAIGRAIAAAGSDDAVVILGKGHETYQMIGATKHAFDDREVARRNLVTQGRMSHG